MKKFETPKIEISKFSIENIVTTSLTNVGTTSYTGKTSSGDDANFGTMLFSFEW